ncbi:MAG: LPS export ABC transporter periplasmic protein LptC [candidate division WOR-3 bacterium]
MRKILILLLSLSCGGKEEIKSGNIQPGADSIEVISTKEGTKMWVMRSQKVVERGDSLVGFGVRITFFSGNKPSSVLTADSGKYNQATGDMVAYGRVHLVSSDSTELWTTSLHWDAKGKIIWTDDSVKIKQRDRVLFAKGMETDAEISYIKFKSPVRGEGEKLE